MAVELEELEIPWVLLAHQIQVVAAAEPVKVQIQVDRVVLVLLLYVTQLTP